MELSREAANALKMQRTCGGQLRTGQPKLDAFLQQAKAYRIFPIPAHSDLNIRFANDVAAYSLKIFTYTGEQRLAAEGDARKLTGRSLSLDLSSLLPGSYSLLVEANGLSHSKPFVKY